MINIIYINYIVREMIDIIYIKISLIKNIVFILYKLYCSRNDRYHYCG